MARIALGAAVLAAAVLVPSAPAFATGYTCSPFGAWQVCLYIYGGGAYVSKMDGTVYNGNGVPEPNVHTELLYPDGSLVKNSNAVTIPADSWGATVTWTPDSNVPTGNYCAIAWRYVNGSYLEQGYACHQVRA